MADSLPNTMIEVDSLSKQYGALHAVRDVSFRVESGDIVGFLGPNGAGKTTTLRILTGFLAATRGRATIAGFDVAQDRQAARRRLGYMPEAFPLYPELRAAEYLRFRAELKGIARRRRRGEVTRVLKLAGADDVAAVRIGHLSKGYRQRVGLADALLGSPPLLILDEPTAGLDPNQIRDVRRLLRSLAPDHTVLLSTHILPEVELTCDRAIVISEGRLVAEGSIDDLRRLRSHSSRIELTVRGDMEGALALIRDQPGVAGARAVQERSDRAGLASLVVDLEPAAAAVDDADAAGELAERLVTRLTEAGTRVRRIAPASSSLEQVFSELTGERATDSSSSGAAAAGATRGRGRTDPDEEARDAEAEP